MKIEYRALRLALKQFVEDKATAFFLISTLCVLFVFSFSSTLASVEPHWLQTLLRVSFVAPLTLIVNSIVFHYVTFRRQMPVK